MKKLLLIGFMCFLVTPALASSTEASRQDIILQCEIFLKPLGNSVLDLYHINKPKSAEPICVKAAQFDPLIWFKLGVAFRGWKPEKSKRYFKKAVSQGVSKAWRFLRETYKRSEVPQKAKEGDPIAQYLMGQNLFDYQHHKEAAIWFGKASKQGEPMAKTMLGWLYLSGMGVEKADLKKGMKLLIEALKQGGEEDQSSVYIFSMGFSPTLPYKKEAYEALVQRYQNGSTDKWFEIAQFIAKESYQLNIPENQEALFWYRKAALAPDSQSLYKYHLGIFLLETASMGDNLYKEGVKWLKEADKEGLDIAHLKLLDIDEITEPITTTYYVRKFVNTSDIPSWLAISYDDGTILPIIEWKNHQWEKATLVKDYLHKTIPKLHLPKFLFDDVTLTHPKKVILRFSSETYAFPKKWWSLKNKKTIKVHAIAQTPTNCNAQWGFIQKGKEPLDPTEKDYIIQFSKQQDFVSNFDIKAVEIRENEAEEIKKKALVARLSPKIRELTKPFKQQGELDKNILKNISIQSLKWKGDWDIFMADVLFNGSDTISTLTNHACPDGRFVGILKNSRIYSSEFTYGVGCDSKSGWYSLPIDAAFVLDDRLFVINAQYSYGGTQHTIHELSSKEAKKYTVDTSRGCE